MPVAATVSPTVRVGAAVTATATDWLADPPAPVHVMPYVVATRGETARDPDVPDGENPFPVPLQAVALALDQASVDDRPLGTEVGDAEKVTVGTGCA